MAKRFLGNVLGVTLMCLGGAVQAAQAPSAATSASSDVLVSEQTLKPRTVKLSFKDMGARGPLMLRGIEGSIGLPFSVRADEVVTAATLKINYTYSPALLQELSHLVVALNDEVASVLPLPKGEGLGNKREIAIDPRLFADYNKLAFRLIGHYTYRCEDPTHSSLWLSLSQLGELELTLSPLALTNDLKYLPNPFYDRRDNAALNLPFVFEKAPSLGTLKAAGIVASWFGGMASYRGATFPAITGSLPTSHAVVFRLADSAGTASEGPSIAIEQNPKRASSKLLVLTGRNEAELQRAARALVLGNSALSGSIVQVSTESEPPARKPYDAPAWLPSDRPVRFGELIPVTDLQVKGYYPDIIRLNFRVAPDLFTWRSQGVPLDLKYRFTRLPFNKNSSLNISINDNFVHALALNDPDRKPARDDQLKLPVLNQDLALREDVLFVPPYQVGGRNQMQFHYYFDVHKQGECRESIPDNMRGMIDPESTIDFSGFPHYAAMPNLAYFANIGFPFTRLADLSETAVVMPDQPAADELRMYLDLMGRMGEATGYPVLRHALVRADAIDSVADRDLLVIGTAGSQPLLKTWAEYLPVMDEEGTRRLREPDLFERARYRWEERDLQALPQPSGRADFIGAGALAAMMAFESPLSSGRSVVVFFADKPAELRHLSRSLMDPERVSRVQGDFVVVRDRDVDHYRVSETYYIGSLPWLLQLRWLFSQHPLLLGGLAVLLALLASVLLYRGLRRIATQRLASRA